MDVTVIGMPKEQEIYNGVNPYSDEGTLLFKKWLKDNNTTYYAAIKEDFSMIEAYRQADKDNSTKLIIENLS